jgi:hypothetical protein
VSFMSFGGFLVFGEGFFYCAGSGTKSL